jgi:hypothetical protein
VEICVRRNLLHNKVVKPFYFAEATAIGHMSFDVLESFACLMLEAV